jgi:oligoendopeptidase F
LRADLDSSDAKSSALMTKFDNRITEASNKITFFSLAIGKIPKEKQKAFLVHKLLVPYAYNLQKIFNNAKYRLPEGEEQIIDLLSQPSYSMWVDGQGRVLAGQTITHEGKEIPLPEAMSLISDMPRPDRRLMKVKINEALKKNSQFAEAELNAIYNYKKVIDERRGFQKPYSSSVLSYENEEKEVEALVSLISKHFGIAHRFYKLHAKLLGQKKLLMEDRNTKIGQIKKKFSFPDTLQIVGAALGSVDLKYKTLLDTYASNGQFDVYPKKGKTGGAYCSKQGDTPTFILLNHTDSLRSVETLGHEMGHAIHGELSQKQPLRYQKYSLATAETASTFFEQVTRDELEKNLSVEEKIVSLHNRISSDVTTIFRQIACFNFELELHERIRKEGQLSKENMAELMRKHLKSYTGEAMDVTHEDGYFFVYWSHIRRFFYVYTYAYGQIVSRALFEKWKKDPSFAKKVEQFLSAGKSMTPRDIFKKIGVDTRDPKFLEAALKGIEVDIKKLETLTRKTSVKK